MQTVATFIMQQRLNTILRDLACIVTPFIYNLLTWRLHFCLLYFILFFLFIQKHSVKISDCYVVYFIFHIYAVSFHIIT